MSHWEDYDIDFYDEDEEDRFEGHCKFCGEQGEWQNLDFGWRLIEHRSAEVHYCLVRQDREVLNIFENLGDT